MKVKRTEDNSAFTVITVEPWPDAPWAADVTVIREKFDQRTGKRVNRARVRYGQHPVPIETAREFANAILRACDIAERLEVEGDIILEDEEPPVSFVPAPEGGDNRGN